jgi:hypothetical protein
MRLQAKTGISCLLLYSSEFISYRCSVLQLCLHCAMNPVRREQDRQYTFNVKLRRFRLKNLQWKHKNAFCLCCCWLTCHCQLQKILILLVPHKFSRVLVLAEALTSWEDIPYSLLIKISVFCFRLSPDYCFRF